MCLRESWRELGRRPANPLVRLRGKWGRHNVHYLTYLNIVFWKINFKTKEETETLSFSDDHMVPRNNKRKEIDRNTLSILYSSVNVSQFYIVT